MGNGLFGWMYIIGCGVFVLLLVIIDKTGVLGGITGTIMACLLGLAAIIAFFWGIVSAISRRMGDKESENAWERENAIQIGAGEKGAMAAESGGSGGSAWSTFFVNALPFIIPILLAAPISIFLGTDTVGARVTWALAWVFAMLGWGFDDFKEWTKTIGPRLAGVGIFLAVLLALAVPGGMLLGSASDASAAAEAAATLAKQTEFSVPASASVKAVIGGILIALSLIVPFIAVVAALKGMFKSSVEQGENLGLPLDADSRSRLMSDWMRDQNWVERKQAKGRRAMLAPILVSYGVMLVGTLIVYSFLAIFIPEFRHIGWPVDKGAGPLWLLLLLPPLVCAPPFLPLFGSLLVGVWMRRKVRDADSLAS